MTAIVGIVSGGKTYLGADSCISYDMSYEIAIENKIFSKQGYILGACGSVRFGNILRYEMAIPEKPEEFTFQEFLIRIFIHELRDTLVRCGLNNNLEKPDGEAFFIGKGGKLGIIYSDMAYERVTDYASIGSGASVATGSLHSTKGMKNPYKRIRKALKASAASVMNVRPPFYYLSI